MALPLPSRYPESLLQYAWQHRRYHAQSLLTTEGQPVCVVRPGTWNAGAGPDFLQAQVRIGKLEFHGHVELHVAGADWYTHGHATDPAYNPVVLHVVAQPSVTPPRRADGSRVPEVVLGDRLDPALLLRYGKLVATEGRLPCAAFFAEVPVVAKNVWFTSLGHARLLEKAEHHRATWVAAAHDWRQALWVALAGAMGGPTNRPAFETLAQRVPYTLLAQHRDQPLALEALLLGAAGLLESPEDDYAQQLAQQWAHYGRLHQLTPLAPGVVSFGRMRPAAFPSLRLAQLAAIAGQRTDWLALLTATTAELGQWLQVPPSAYWQHHYRLGVPTARPIRGGLGQAQVHHLLINTLLPFAVLYHTERGDYAAVEAAGEQLAGLPHEAHALARLYAGLGYRAPSALHTQGAVHLHRHYCQPRACLRCTVGHHILQPTDDHART
ncbi:MAG: DUF2851 family protein [Bacteroidia bacterium]|nr:DUF2851 family protein [Bacteroidia bacterium]